MPSAGDRLRRRSGDGVRAERGPDPRRVPLLHRKYDVERYFRDAALNLVGEGTNEIQLNVIAGQLVARGGI